MADEGGRGDLDASIIVAFGGNLAADHGPVRAQLERALSEMARLGLEVVRRSRFWRSAAWPDGSDPPFLNMIALIETNLSAEQTLQALHRLERDLGRVRGRPNGPRTVDLDLIAFGREVRQGELVLPHPRAAERHFVMGPLSELAPDWRHPVSGERAEDLARCAPIGRDARPIADDG